MRALILEDSRATRIILRRMLCKIGFEVCEAENGSDGLERLKGMEPPDLVTVDWEMPVMDGLAFVQAVRADHAYDRVPLLMVTTLNNVEQVATALGSGANEYIMKPFTDDVIREKLELMGVLQV